MWLRLLVYFGQITARNGHANRVSQLFDTDVDCFDVDLSNDEIEWQKVRLVRFLLLNTGFLCRTFVARAYRELLAVLVFCFSFPDTQMRLICLLLLLVAAVVAQPSLSIQTPATIYAGIDPPLQEIVLLQPAVVPPTPGGFAPIAVVHYPVTIVPTVSAGLTIIPASIVLSDANNFRSSYKIVTGAPPTFGTDGRTAQPYNITFDAQSDFAGYSSLDVTRGGNISPRMCFSLFMLLSLFVLFAS